MNNGFDPTTPQNLASKLIKYEDNEMPYDEMVDLFQYLIPLVHELNDNSGTVWTPQGHYGRTAQRLIIEGKCTLP